MTTPNNAPTPQGAYDEVHQLEAVPAHTTSEVITRSKEETSEFLGQSATLQYWNLV